MKRFTANSNDWCSLRFGGRRLAAVMAFVIAFVANIQGVTPKNICGGVSTNICDSVLWIGRDVDSIPAFAYSGCDKIREIRFESREGKGGEMSKDGATVRPLRIGDYAFMGCGNLREVRLPEFVESLGEGCFKNCEALSVLRMDETRIKATPKYMAAGCVSLREVALPKNVEKLGAHGFIYCSSLERLDIPEGVRNIGSNFLSECRSLKEIYFPDSVVELESYVCSECVSLVKVRLPGNPSLLGELMFSGCRNLVEIEEPSPTPPPFDCNSFIFEPDEEAMYAKCRLIVPEGNEAAYGDAHGWSLFRKISE